MPTETGRHRVRPHGGGHRPGARHRLLHWFGLEAWRCMFLTEALPALDRVGRKPLLLLGSVGMTIALARLVLAVGSGTTNAQGQLVLVSPANVIALAAANIYAFFFAFTWGPVARVLLGEMFGRARTDVNTRRAPDCLT